MCVRVWKATYFANADLSRPVLGNGEHLRFPYHEPAWCASGSYFGCDSTRLDASVDFEWGSDSPLWGGLSLEEKAFPGDYFR